MSIYERIDQYTSRDEVDAYNTASEFTRGNTKDLLEALIQGVDDDSLNTPGKRKLG